MGMNGTNIAKKVGSVDIESAIANTSEYYDLLKTIPYIQNYKLYYMVIKNNTSASQYKGVTSILYSGDWNLFGGVCVIFERAVNATTSVSTSWSFDVTANSTVEIYELLK